MPTHTLRRVALTLAGTGSLIGAPDAAARLIPDVAYRGPAPVGIHPGHGTSAPSGPALTSHPVGDERPRATLAGGRQPNAAKRVRLASSYDSVGGIVSPWARAAVLAPAPELAPGRLATIGLADDGVDSIGPDLAAVRALNPLIAPIPGDAVPGHGTMVASVAAAAFDGTGVVGVAPGARVLSWDTPLTCDGLADGIIQLVKSGAQVINVSLATEDECLSLWEATAFAYAKGVAIVAAAGNEGQRLNPRSFPASYPHVITVGAVDGNLRQAPFSEFNDQVDLAAPGVGVPVALPAVYDTRDGIVDGVAAESGTSFAAPFVTGAAAWILGARPGLDPSQLAAVLQASARDLDVPGPDPYTGFGLPQITTALTTPAPDPDLLEPNDHPAFTRPASRGVFGKRAIWMGARKAARITAVGDSADDPIDAYRVIVPARSRADFSLHGQTGRTNLFVYDARDASFDAPLDGSSRPGLQTDRLSIRNTSRRPQAAFVVVNSAPIGTRRAASSYRLTVGRG